MPVRAGDLEFLATLRDEVSAKLKGINENIGKHREKYVAAGAAITAFSALAGREFDAVKTKIAQGTGASGEALDGLIGSFQNLAGTVAGTSNEQVAGAIADINTKFDLTDEKLEGLATKVLQAKQAFGEFDVETFGRTMEAYGIEAEEAGGKLDYFGTVAQDTGLPLGELLTQAQTYGPVLKNLGLDAEESAVFLGKLHESGVDVSRVMPGMNQAMRKAAKEGVTDLKGHLDLAIESIRTADSDTDALRIATETFGAEGAQRMVASIRTGILPALADLDSQYENTEGRTEEVYNETVSLADGLINLKNKAFALVGPVGDAAAGISAVATGAVLAGPGIVTMGTAIGTKLLPLLAGPAGLVLVLGALAGAILLSRDNLDKFKISVGEFSALTEQKMMQVITDVDERIRGLKEDMVLYGDVLGETSTEIAALEVKKRELIEALNDHREAARDSKEATEDSTAAVGANAEAVVEAEEDWKAWTAEVERLSAQMDLAKLINEEMMTSLTRESEVAIEDVIGQFGRLGPEAFDPIEPGLVAPASRGVEGMKQTFQQGMNEAVGIISTGLDLAGQKGAAAFLRQISSMVSTALSLLDKIAGFKMPSFGGGAAGGGGAAAGAGGAGAGAGGLGALAPIGAAAGLAAAAYGIGRVATNIIDTSARNRYTVEEIEKRFPLAGQGGGTPTPPDQHIHINIDGQEVASVVARRLPGVADEEGW